MLPVSFPCRALVAGLLLVLTGIFCPLPGNAQSASNVATDPLAPAAPPLAPIPLPQLDGEYIILTGGVSLMMWEKYKAEPHDHWWLNFIRASRIRIAQVRAQYGPGAKITWLVYQRGYQRRQDLQEHGDLFSVIRSIPEAYGVKLVLYNRAQDVINYLNDRSTGKIAGFEYFGHSNKACFLFDYSNEIDSASKVWLHEDDLTKIHRSDFARDAYAKSWSCHTGESMSQKFQAATGIKMIGASGKTQYMTDTLPIISTPGGKWIGE